MPFINMGPSLNPYGPPQQGPPDPNMAQDPQVQAPDLQNAPYGAPGGPRTGNQATDAPEPSFAGSGYPNIEPAITLPPLPESGNTAQPRPGDSEAIQAPKLTPPRRDFMSAVGRALMSSPHALGRFLGGVLLSGQANDDAANQQAQEDFRNQALIQQQKLSARNSDSLLQNRQALETLHQAQIDKLNQPQKKTYRTEQLMGPDHKLHSFDVNNADPNDKIDQGLAKEQGANNEIAWASDNLNSPDPAKARAAKAILSKAEREPKEPVDSFEKETYNEWASAQQAAGKPHDRMTFNKEKAATTGKAQATSAKVSQDIADVDTNIDMIPSLRAMAQAELQKHPHEAGAKLNSLMNEGKYKLGLSTEPEYEQMFPMLAAFKAYATGPLLHGIRNQKLVNAIWAHIPNGTDAPSLKLKKLDVMDGLMRQARSEKAAAANIEPRSDRAEGEPVPGLSKPPQAKPKSAATPAAASTPASSGLKPNWKYRINGQEVTTDANGNPQ